MKIYVPTPVKQNELRIDWWNVDLPWIFRNNLKVTIKSGAMDKNITLRVHVTDSYKKTYVQEKEEEENNVHTYNLPSLFVSSFTTPTVVF